MKPVKMLVHIPPIPDTQHGDRTAYEMRRFNLNIVVSACGRGFMFRFPGTKRYHTQFIATLLVFALKQLPEYNVYTCGSKQHIKTIYLIPSDSTYEDMNF